MKTKVDILKRVCNTTVGWIKYKTYQGVTICECYTGEYTALFLGPSFSVWVQGTGISYVCNIQTTWRLLPAVSKLHHISNYSQTSGGIVIDKVAIIVTAKTTDFTLEEKKQVFIATYLWINYY